MEAMTPSEASPASLMKLGVCMPSPPMNFDLMPSSIICFTMGPACGSMPPNMMRSGFLPLILVNIALKSVSLSVVCSRATIRAPAAFTVASNASASPWP
ncbi:hypothetical protein D3C83_30430 [compost metagenome]